ncbi:hypothetical protein M1N64_02390 [Peptococcaceae bacterium]|nr:hypothetical protein [Peptococcaceae bacterium]
MGMPDEADFLKRLLPAWIKPSGTWKVARRIRLYGACVAISGNMLATPLAEVLAPTKAAASAPPIVMEG